MPAPPGTRCPAPRGFTAVGPGHGDPGRPAVILSLPSASSVPRPAGAVPRSGDRPARRSGDRVARAERDGGRWGVHRVVMPVGCPTVGSADLLPEGFGLPPPPPPRAAPRTAGCRCRSRRRPRVRGSGPHHRLLGWSGCRPPRTCRPRLRSRRPGIRATPSMPGTARAWPGRDTPPKAAPATALARNFLDMTPVILPFCWCSTRRAEPVPRLVVL